MLRLRTHDCTGGFRCYSIRALQFLVTRPLRSSGYSALVELLTRCERGGLTIVELPITFTDRTRGESKISRQEIFRAMATVILGGLVTSTALNLLVLPTLAWRWGKFGRT